MLDVSVVAREVRSYTFLLNVSTGLCFIEVGVVWL